MPNSDTFFDSSSLAEPVFLADQLPPGHYGLSLTYDYDPDPLDTSPPYRQIIYTTFEFVEPSYTLTGDVHVDGKIDINDLALLAAKWLTDCSVTPMDPDCVMLKLDE